MAWGLPGTITSSPLVAHCKRCKKNDATITAHDNQLYCKKCYMHLIKAWTKNRKLELLESFLRASILPKGK